jgi:hypothetical protein
MERTNADRILVRISLGKRSLGRLGRNDTEMDLWEIG